MYRESEGPSSGAIFSWVTVALIVIGILITSLMIGCPKYRVYQQTMEGKAELARATYNRQIKTQEAKATLESAKDVAQAEIIRAGGIAKANAIIGSSLKDNEAYLHWKWIDQLENNKNAVFYVPTERNLPIMTNSPPKIPSIKE